LYKFILDKYAKQGDKILDTHLGSGSIAIACHDYGFELTCCELDVDYYNKAVERIKNHISQIKLEF
jgi:site-specific DNA-methyltransferase (adenine-specific)